MAEGLRPRRGATEEWDRTQHRFGWQMLAAKSLQLDFRENVLMPSLPAEKRALLRSQSCPFSSTPFVAFPTTKVTKFDLQLFRLLLLRRIDLPLPLSIRNCWCGRPLDSLGHHRAACAVAGVLGRTGFPLESAAARVCREAGARVRTNVMVRDLDLWPPQRIDNRRLEVVTDGLPLHGRAQLAIDTTMVSARPGADRLDGVALAEARRRKERTYPELSGEGGRAKLVVLAVEVCGRWSGEAHTFLGALATAKARSPPLLQHNVRAAWLHRWRCLLAHTATRNFAMSHFDTAAPGVVGDVPSLHDVLSEGRYFL